ncbi:EvpB/family type VI secretion protein [Klebsiella pneumoniae]|nr:EvpB/family type VI secretion protein [Klebsiella pneumoniae]
MSVTTENAPVQGQTTLQENRAGEGVYASLFEKINLAPASRLGDINDFLDDAALSEAPAAERLTAAMQVVYGTHPSVRPAGGKARQNADRPPYRRAGFPDKPSAGRGDAPSGVSAGRIPVARPQTAGGQHRLSAETSKRRSSTSPKTICARTLRTRRSLSRAASTGTPIPRSMTLPAASRSAR